MENQKKTNFTQISNICLYDRNLSLDARGLMSILMSYPNDWHFYNENIAKIANVGVDKLNKLYKHLEIYGYLKRTKKRDSKGRFRGFEFKICDKGSFKMLMSAEFITEKTPLLQKSALDIALTVKSVVTNTHLTKYKFYNLESDYQDKMIKLNQKLLQKQLSKDIQMLKLENLAVSNQNQIDF